MYQSLKIMVLTLGNLALGLLVFSINVAFADQGMTNPVHGKHLGEIVWAKKLPIPQISLAKLSGVGLHKVRCRQHRKTALPPFTAYLSRILSGNA